MADSKLRLVSLTVLGGALDGRRHDPEEVVTEILIGSDPDCHLVVDLPGVSPIHARIWADLDQSVVHDTHAPRGLYVNATRVEGQAPIGEGDVLWLGPPQEPDSVCVQCHFAPWVEVLPTGRFVEPAVGAASSDDDPFFVGDAPGGGFVPPPKPATAVEEPLVEGTVLETDAAPGPDPLSPEAPTPTPEALVAETVADDWAIAEEAPTAPAAAPPAPPVAPAGRNAPEPPPDVSASADEFFVAEEPQAQAADEAVFVEVEPLPAEPLLSAPASAFELPPLEPLAGPPPERAPVPPQRAAALPLPPEPAPPVAFLPETPVEPVMPALASPPRPARRARARVRRAASPRPAAALPAIARASPGTHRRSATDGRPPAWSVRSTRPSLVAEYPRLDPSGRPRGGGVRRARRPRSRRPEAPRRWRSPGRCRAGTPARRPACDAHRLGLCLRPCG